MGKPLQPESKRNNHDTKKSPYRQYAMSVAAMSWAWQLDITPTEKLTLLALADHANDENYTCWPSLTHLENKTGLSRTSIWRSIDVLVDHGLVDRKNDPEKSSTVYRLKVGAQRNNDGEITRLSNPSKRGSQPNAADPQRLKLIQHNLPNNEPSLGAQRNKPGELCDTKLGAGCNVMGAQRNKVGAQRNKVGAVCTPNHKNYNNHQEPEMKKTSSPAPVKTKKPKTGKSLATDWTLPKEWQLWTEKDCPLVDPVKTADEFKDWAIANANRAVARKADWFATWRNWCRKEQARYKDQERWQKGK